MIVLSLKVTISSTAQQRNNSIELDQDEVDRVLQDIKDEDDKHIKYCKKAIKDMDYSDEDDDSVIFETEESLTFHLNLPGVDFKDIKSASAPPLSVKISGSCGPCMPEHLITSTRQCPSDCFESIIALKHMVDIRNASVKYENGVLKVNLPKETGQEIPITFTH
ncbi:hypothetical protein BDB00DRAFT_873103 [Zychaea mexicana]|uniref:uncharacterized protein n=1 Tax=Zychaea mexicana TaxID=64656 RepID=UPI0022FF3255|nr:uncharacterized protein BDB00DRAFT_873103 [Zychaea mexicana]KAI9492703.1 hypothetical protein BDB00DRAFT_873103 [Zychaea mexicana]